MNGRIAIINSDGSIITSAEFIGNIGPTNIGKRIIKLLKNANNSMDYVDAIRDFSLTNHKAYNEDVCRIVSGDWYNTCHDYENKWNCDYIYIKNLSSDTRYFVTPDGFVALPPNEILTLHLGKLIKKDKLAHINVGDVVTVADINWIVLKKTDNSVYCLTKDFINTMPFSKNTQNYKEAEIRTYLQGFAKRIKDKVGENALISREVNLTTSHGHTIFGTVTDIIGLLTKTECVEFKSILKKNPINGWWWLATADSIYNYSVSCINGSSTVVYNSYDHTYGVRPACLFHSSVFEN